MDVVVYAVLCGRSRDGTGVVTVPQSAVMSALGRAGAEPAALTGALRRLVGAGFLKVSRAHVNACYTYRLLVRPGGTERFDVIPYALMGAVAAGQVCDAAVVTWLHLDERLGARGWTSSSPEELMVRAGGGARTVRNHVGQLLEIDGVLTVTRLQRHGWMLSRPADQMPSGVGGGERVVQAPDGVGPRAVREKFDGSVWKKTTGPIEDLTLEDLTPEPAPSSQRSCDRPGSDAREPATSGLRPKQRRRIPSGGVFARDDVQQVVDLLDSVWVNQWLGGVAARTARFLDHGMPVMAAAWAINRFSHLEDHGGREVPAVEAGLRLVWREINQGLACRECGRDDDVQDGLCLRCTPEAPMDGELLPLAQRVALYRQMGVPLEELRDVDPEGAAVLAANLEPPVAVSREEAGGRPERPGLGSAAVPDAALNVLGQLRPAVVPAEAGGGHRAWVTAVRASTSSPGPHHPTPPGHAQLPNQAHEDSAPIPLPDGRPDAACTQGNKRGTAMTDPTCVTHRRPPPGQGSAGCRQLHDEKWPWTGAGGQAGERAIEDRAREVEP